MNITKQINICKYLDIIKLTNKKDFEIKLIDTFTGEFLILDNSFMNKKPLKLKEYIPLCQDMIIEFKNNVPISNLSLQ